MESFHSAPEPLRLESTGSALTAAREDAGLGAFGSVFADVQTSGRGQYGRAWQSVRGNVHAAIRLPFVPPYSTLACAAALSSLLVDELARCGFDVRLKWPNDIVGVSRGRPFKAGGVLIEEKEGTILAGIGLNLVWAPGAETLREGAALPPGTLLDAAGRGADERVSAAFSLWKRLAARIASEPPERLAEIWRPLAIARLLWRGRTVALIDGDGRVTASGVLSGIAAGGEAMIGRSLHTSGSLVPIESSEESQQQEKSHAAEIL